MANLSVNTDAPPAGLRPRRSRRLPYSLGVKGRGTPAFDPKADMRRSKVLHRK